MANMSVAQAKEIAGKAYSKIFPADYLENLNDHAFLNLVIDTYILGGLTPEQALNKMTTIIPYYAQSSNKSTFPGFGDPVATHGDPDKFVTDLPTAALVAFIYPEGTQAAKDSMVAAIDSGVLNKVTFTQGFLKADASIANPTVADVVKAVQPGIPVVYPDSGLQVPGVTLDQQDFVIAMYASAFGRAAEHNGLKYWAGKLNAELATGSDQTTAYAAVSKQMYIDGKGNNEGGTNLADAAYVNYAYQNILGRAGDSGGIVYWNQKLSSGEVDRGSFVAKFVGDAIGNAGDSDFLEARIAVGKFVAQEHVSGPNAPSIDLKAIIQGVTDETSANAAITAIVEKYGTAASPKKVAFAELLSSWEEPATAETAHSDVSVAGIELIGTATVSTDLFIAA